MNGGPEVGVQGGMSSGDAERTPGVHFSHGVPGSSIPGDSVVGGDASGTVPHALRSGGSSAGRAGDVHAAGDPRLVLIPAAVASADGRSNNGDIRSASRDESATPAGGVDPSARRNVLDQLFAPTRSAAVVPAQLSFVEYLALVKAEPQRFLRNAAGYVRDALTYDVDPSRTTLRQGVRVPVYPFLSDLHQSPASRDPAFGMDRVAHRLCEVLDEQAILPYPRRWPLLFGPFASGKSTFVAAMLRRVQDFSEHHPDGVMYRPFFEFPREKAEPLRLFLPAGCQFDPLFLLPKTGVREAFVAQAMTNLDPERARGINEAYALRDGQDPLVERLLRALVSHEKGDLRTVLEKYVRVERIAFSAGEGVGLAIIEPQRRASASAASLWDVPQVLSEELPAELRAIARDLQVVSDPVLATNRGLVLFDNIGHELGGDGAHDEPTTIDPYRETIEGGVLRVSARTDSGAEIRRVFPLDTVFMGCMNDAHLAQFLERPERSGRLLSIARGINAPLLLNCFDERELLEHKLRARVQEATPESRTVSPHVTLLLSLFAVSTRVLRPQGHFYKDHHSEPPKLLGEIAEKLSGVSKAIFLSLPSESWPTDAVNWALPSRARLGPADLSQLFAYQHLVSEEFSKGVGVSRASLYDGGIGIDGRDLEGLLLDFVSSSGVKGLSTSALMRFLERRAHTPFPFQTRLGAECDAEIDRLSEGADGQSGVSERVRESIQRLADMTIVDEPAKLVEALVRVGRRLIRHDVTRALELPFSSQAHQEFKKYLAHVRAIMVPGVFEIPKEYRVNPQSPKPDTQYLQQIRARLGIAEKDKEVENQKIMDRLNKWVGANPDANVLDRLGEVFPDLVEKLEGHFRRENIVREREFLEDSMKYSRNPELVHRDLERATDKTRVQRWKRGWERLTSGDAGLPRYPEALLLDEIVWAYQGVFRREPGAGAGTED